MFLHFFARSEAENVLKIFLSNFPCYTLYHLMTVKVILEQI